MAWWLLGVIAVITFDALLLGVILLGELLDLRRKRAWERQWNEDDREWLYDRGVRLP